MKKEPNNLDEEVVEGQTLPTEEEKKELESLLKAIKDLEEAKIKNEESTKKKGFIAIEFGGVFHHNLYVNFIFTFILNLTLAFLIIELFSFAKYDSLTYFILFLLIYTILESVFRIYVLMNHFTFIVKTLGFIFFFGYIIIFFALDQFIFMNTFVFVNETLFVVFVGMFTVVRYVISYLLRQNFRKRNLR